MATLKRVSCYQSFDNYVEVYGFRFGVDFMYTNIIEIVRIHHHRISTYAL